MKCQTSKTEEYLLGWCVVGKGFLIVFKINYGTQIFINTYWQDVTESEEKLLSLQTYTLSKTDSHPDSTHSTSQEKESSTKLNLRRGRIFCFYCQIKTKLYGMCECNTR